MSVDNCHLTDLPDIKTACCTFFVKILKNIQICLVRRSSAVSFDVRFIVSCCVRSVNTCSLVSIFTILGILSVCALEVDGISKPCTK